MKSWYSNLWRYSNLKWIFESPMISKSPNLKFKSASLKKFSNSAVKRKFFFKLYCIYNYINNLDIYQRFKHPFEIWMSSEIRISIWDLNAIGDSNIHLRFEYHWRFEYIYIWIYFWIFSNIRIPNSNFEWKL